MARCVMQDCSAAPFAVFVCSPEGHSVLLCQRHLDVWLDNADDDPYLEPFELMLVGR